MLIDEARIHLIAGRGGNGCVAFRREKFVPRGGPSGGDGGRGGHIYVECSDRVNTLLHFQYKRLFRAERGRHGEGGKRHGRNGADLVIPVPPGTQVFQLPEGALLHDFSTVGERLLVARGGSGGRGNARFTTPTRQAPRIAEPGRPGDEVELSLTLKLIADVGLVGLPNVGKSTLISRISSARPKIADYPFTTLEPHLGVVALADFRSFVVADIPGLIEGAHQGQGLGDRFLKHVERTKVLVHLIDVSQPRDPIQDYKTVIRELSLFNADLARRRQLVLASKLDALDDPRKITRLKIMCARRRIPFHAVSSVSGKGIPELIALLARMLRL
ncbi:MAG: GTPase ObgE [Acidobacteria bacterium]|nr:GTPase ObgE [Acidobacteriota bacterium]